MNTKTEYIVKTSSAHMPSSCWGAYKRVAVMEVQKGTVPKMISKRACGVVRIVTTWERLNVGKTKRCAYEVALAEAERFCDELNNRKRRELVQREQAEST